jgi:hypothetical protein
MIQGKNGRMYPGGIGSSKAHASLAPLNTSKNAEIPKILKPHHPAKAMEKGP